MTKKEMISHLVGEGEHTESELKKMSKPEVEELFNERFEVIEEKDLSDIPTLEVNEEIGISDFIPQPPVVEKQEEEGIEEEEVEEIDISKLSKHQLRHFKRTGRI